MVLSERSWPQRTTNHDTVSVKCLPLAILFRLNSRLGLLGAEDLGGWDVVANVYGPSLGLYSKTACSIGCTTQRANEQTYTPGIIYFMC